MGKTGGRRDEYDAEIERVHRRDARAFARALPLVAPDLARKYRELLTPMDGNQRIDPTRYSDASIDLCRMAAGLAVRPPTVAEADANRAAAIAMTVSEEAGPKLGGEARALAVLTEHPGWTVAQIAKAAGVSRTTLYRYEKFQHARRVMQGVGRAKYAGTSGRT